ncbi:unnamed protein product [Clonostachys rosea f. rosea IK726]|uniref:Uncharacterized protein n=1 Tax=Clonostachys rosea f. rosea IK726 TaxID=1349383 RepID=A0ACA9TF07_BIOOC|nr:unnamed protein product [Clonostachys rosea f. rosea IK726]
MEHNQSKDDHPQGAAPPDRNSLNHGEEASANARTGKGTSLPDRLWASGRMAAQAMTTPSAQAVQSLSASSSSKAGPLPGFPVSAGESSNIAQDVAAHGRGASFTTASASGSRQAGRHDSAAKAFDDFTAHSQEPPILDGQNPRDLLRPDETKQIEEMDGLAVVNILSQPDPDEMMPTGDDFDTGLSPEAASKLRSALFDTGLHGWELLWNDMLNFTPQFLVNPSDGINEGAQQLTGTSEQTGATNIWIQQWGDVLSHYTDEVWGDLGPLVSEARQEIKNIASQDEAGQAAPGQARALGRLRMIIAHLRGGSG